MNDLLRRLSNDYEHTLRTLSGLCGEVLFNRLLPVDGEMLRHEEVIDGVEDIALNVVECISTVLVPLVCHSAHQQQQQHYVASVISNVVV